MKKFISTILSILLVPAIIVFAQPIGPGTGSQGITETEADGLYLKKAGISGGQTAAGGTGTGENLILRSNTNSDGVIFADRLLVGTETADCPTIGGSLHTCMFGSSIDAAATTDINVRVTQYGDTAGIGSNIFGNRTRNTKASPTVVQSDDNVFDLVAAGFDGTDFAQLARIDMEVDGTPGNNDMPGRIVFKTSVDGTQTPAEVLRLAQNKLATFAGNIIVPAGGTMDVAGAGTFGIATSAGANTITIGGATSTVNIPGNLTIDGNVTVIGAAAGDLSIGDNNITNVGDIALDTISSDAGTTVAVVLGGAAGNDFIVDTSTLVVESDNDRVGIGTTSPGQKLEVNTATSDDGIVINGSGANGLRHRLNATGTGGRNYHMLSTANSSGFGGGKFVISDNTASDTARLVIDSSGEVSVGSISSDGTGKAVCIKSDGNLGTCSDAVGAGGTCTCG